MMLARYRETSWAKRGQMGQERPVRPRKLAGQKMVSLTLRREKKFGPERPGWPEQPVVVKRGKPDPEDPEDQYSPFSHGGRLFTVALQIVTE